MSEYKCKVAFVSSFLPRMCGIATFTNDLINNTALAAKRRFEPLVVAMENGSDAKYNDPVKFEIRRNVKNDYVSAADYINFSDVNVVSIQHEFGLFGGEAGAYLNILLRRIKAPIVSTMHTVLDEPTDEYYKSTINLCDLSDKIVVMNERGMEMLHSIYGIDESKIELIPHGIPDLSFVDSSYYKHQYGMDGRKTILTFGLLGRSKGIENVLRALPEVIKVDPSVLYIILGMTHPEVKKFEGESYRFELQRIIKELNLHEHVMFHNRFVSDQELSAFLSAADIYVTPYLHREQLTSGTLAFAVGTGKAVISTPYWAAEELLADGRGKLVKFASPPAIAEAMIEIINNDELFHELRHRAYGYGRDITWPQIGGKYWELFSSQEKTITPIPHAHPTRDSVSVLQVPEPPLDHLKRMTDDTGLYQHAKLTIPDRDHGYCTDDNARAVIAMTKYYSQYPDKEALRLFDIYLSFTCHSQQEDGSVKNFMRFDRSWIKGEPAHDSLSRVLWAFGSVMANPPSPAYMSIIKECFDKTVIHVPDLSNRGLCYAIFGMADYLKQFPGASDIKRYMSIASQRLVSLYEKNSSSNWEWFEDILAYDNAVMPHALFIAWQNSHDQKYLDIAIKTAEFLLENTFNGQHFSFIGCQGWYKKGKDRASFDQQPLEVVSTVLMLKTAYDATGNQQYLSLQKRAFDWFLGENDLGIPVYNFKTKGCYDGLCAGGVNLNQGAESVLSFLLALLCVVESYNIGGDHIEPKEETTEAIPVEQV